MTDLYPEVHIEYPDRRYLSAREIQEHGRGEWIPKPLIQTSSAATETALEEVKS